MTVTEPETQVASLPHQRRRRALHAGLDAYERYIDPDKQDMAIRIVARCRRHAGQMLYNGRPARFTFKNFQVVGSNEQLDEVGVKDLGASDEEGGQVDPRLAAHPAQPAQGARRRGPQGLRQEVPRACRSSSTTRPTGSP